MPAGLYSIAGQEGGRPACKMCRSRLKARWTIVTIVKLHCCILLACLTGPGYPGTESACRGVAKDRPWHVRA
eukprot:7433631-Lingulodinium_polyedra.AAC.1